MRDKQHHQEPAGKKTGSGFSRDDVDHDPHSNRPEESRKDAGDKHSSPGAAHAGSDAGPEEDNNP